VVRALAKDSAWVRNHENIFVLGPTGVGKSFIASALAQKACRNGHSALYLRAAALLRELALARADESLRNFLARLGRIDVLVIDDWAMAPLNENERREVWEICEDRYQTRSTVLTSQLPLSRWHEQIAIPPSPMASSTLWFTTPTASKCAASPCARNAIRHRTRRRNEPKPVSVRCLSYGPNFPEPDSGQLPEPASRVCQARKPSARSPGQWRRKLVWNRRLPDGDGRAAHACAMIAIPLLRRPARSIVERPPPSQGATGTALLLRSR